VCAGDGRGGGLLRRREPVEGAHVETLDVDDWGTGVCVCVCVCV
jgi:hypothetical protein